MALKPGNVSDFTNSMAKDMADAFASEWLAVKGGPLPAAGEEDRNLLFAAIAQGVVKHLKDKANDAFQISVQVTQSPAVLMESDNPNNISSAGGSINAGQADVRQKNAGDNMLVSEGSATNVTILTE